MIDVTALMDQLALIADKEGILVWPEITRSIKIKEDKWLGNHGLPNNGVWELRFKGRFIAFCDERTAEDLDSVRNLAYTIYGAWMFSE